MHRITRLAVSSLSLLILPALAHAQLAPPIENPTNTYLTWGDYKIEVNQYGDLGRNWPTPDLFWQQYALLKEKARANKQPPNTLTTLLLMLPRTEATAIKREGDKEIVVGTKYTEMTPDEIKWNLDQWREFEDMIYVWSAGNAWMRTDVKIIDEVNHVKADEKWGFFSGQHRDLLDKYLPFQRGDYQSYNCIYNSKDLGASPHGGTIGALYGIRGCGTSDNAYYGRQRRGNRTGYVALHEWLNQQCSATSSMMPYPDGESLWNNYVLHKMGYREDTQLDAWPWASIRRDTMMHIIRPAMWRRWSTIDPYKSKAIEKWVMFGPAEPNQGRAMTTAPRDKGMLVEQDLDTYETLNLVYARQSSEEGPDVKPGTHYFRTYVQSDERKEVRLWAGADERFKLWLNGVMIRDGWGWNYTLDDGQMVEKAAYPTLEKGLNTLVLELPNDNNKVEFRVRFCDVDGSGRQPKGVQALVALEPGQQPVALAEPVVYDFKQPKLFKWADINEDPWLLMPRLSEAELRDLTGIPTLAIKTNGAKRPGPDGKEYTPQQHLFLDVPKDAVASPWIAAPAEDNAQLNNDFDYNWKSLAWLRCTKRPGADKDVLFLRFDVAEPLMHLLKTRGRPAAESIVGWTLVEHKLAYVVLVDLDLKDGKDAPKTALGLLTQQPE